MSSQPRPDDALSGTELAWVAVGVCAIALSCWLVPTVVAVLYSGHVPRLGLFDAIRSLGRLFGEGHLGDPASAYPAHARAAMPGAVGWWCGVAWGAAVIGSVVAAFMRHVEPLIAAERLGRRPYDWRGSRPRAWARPRDMRRRSTSGTGFSIGTIDGRPVATDEEEHIVVVAPTRAGKTTRCVIPWLLEHTGPAIVTSTKRDVLEATRTARARQGRIWIFDPFGKESATWSPLTGCRDWSYALRQAQWLADASSDGGSEIARYWRGEAAKLLAPLLHAAVLADAGMPDVLTWVDAQELAQPTATLRSAGADDARAQLRAVAELDPRNKGTTYMSAGSVLAAYRYPEVRASHDDELTPRRFIDSAGDTLYLVAAERHQLLLAPLLVSLVSSLVHEAIECEAFATPGRRLRLLLDEAANIAPLPQLPRLLSQGAGHGIRIATVWQSIAQMRERYGVSADTLLANSTSKLFLGPVADEATLRYIQGLVCHAGEASDRGPAVGRALQQLGGGRSILLRARYAPSVVIARAGRW